MKLTQKTLAVCLMSAALLGSYGVSAQTQTPQTPQTSPSRSFTTELAKANLAQTGVTTPTDEQLLAAETSIQKMRDDDRMGWGQIANALGLSLGAVVSAANRAEPATLNAANKAAATGQYGQSATATSRSGTSAGSSGGNGGGGNGGGNGGGGGRGK